MTRIKGPGQLPKPPAGSAGAELDATRVVPGSSAGATPVADARGVPASHAVAPGDAIARIARELGEGSLDVEQAMERLLEHSVADAQGQLTEIERSELVALLREALAEDPALGALRESVR